MTYTPTNWVDGTTSANAARLNNMESGIVAADPTATVNTSQGTWLNGATDGLGSTTSSARFTTSWRNGICILHIDFKRGSSTEVIGTLGTGTPNPTVLTEVQIDQATGAYIWINSNDNSVHATGTSTIRYETNLMWHY